MPMKPALFALSLCLAAGPALAGAKRHDCVIDPSQVLQIGSAVDGIIQTIHVSRGDQVKKGAPIAQLESEAETAALTYARERAEDMGPIEIAQSRVALLKTAARRAADMGAKGIMPTAKVEEAQTDYEVAELELQRAKVDQRLAKLDVTRVAAQLKRRTILSPVDGIVTKRMLGPGEYVYSQSPLVKIAQIDPLYVEVFLPTEMYPGLHVGDMADVFPAAPVGGDHRAKIIAVDKVFDAASDTFGVRLSLANPEGNIPAGIDCQVAFQN